MIDDLIREGDGLLQKLIQTAFERGRDVGRAEANALKTRLASVLSDFQQPDSTHAPEPMAPAAEQSLSGQTPDAAPLAGRSPAASRAPRGSNRPIVLDYLRSAHRGLRPAIIAEHTGTNENSVRAMLNILRHEGFARKDGDLWFAVRSDQTNEAADLMSVGDQSAASESDPVQDREAGPRRGT